MMWDNEQGYVHGDGEPTPVYRDRVHMATGQVDHRYWFDCKYFDISVPETCTHALSQFRMMIIPNDPVRYNTPNAMRHHGACGIEGKLFNQRDAGDDNTQI